MKKAFKKSKIVSLMSVAALLASLLLVCDSHYSFISIASAHQKNTSEKEVAVPSCHDVSSENTKTETKSDNDCPICASDICQRSIAYLLKSKDQTSERLEVTTDEAEQHVAIVNNHIFIQGPPLDPFDLSLYRRLPFLSIFKNIQSYLMVFRN